MDQNKKNSNKKNSNKKKTNNKSANSKNTNKKYLTNKGANGKNVNSKKANNKSTKQKAPKLNLPKGWIYMTKEEVSASQLGNCLTDAQYDVEVWIDAAVMEVSLGEKASIDFEQLQLPFEDEYSDSFMQEKGFCCAYYVTFPEESYEKVKDLLATLRKSFEGDLFGDTDTFEPRI